MSSESTPHATSDVEDDHLIDLGDVFRHPAGLRTARFIVSSFLRASSNTETPPGDLFSSVSLPFLDTDESNSDTAKILRDLLAFKDTEEDTHEQREEPTTLISTTNEDLEHPTNLSTSARNNSVLRQMITDDYSTASQNTSVLPNGYTTFQPYNAASTQIPSAFSVDLSQSHNGTDSPYRVESPFRVENNDPNPQASSHHSSNTQSLNQYNIGQLPHIGSMHLSNGDNSTNGDATMKNGLNSAVSVSRISGRPPPHKQPLVTNSGRATTKELASIKSFLPVNKGGEGHSIHARKEPPNMNSTSNRRIMPNSPSTVNNQTQRLPDSTKTTNFSPILPADNNNNNNNHPQSSMMEVSISKGGSKKRKSKGDGDGAPSRKRKSTEKTDKAKRAPKSKEPKPEPARYKLGPDLWMRILEFTPPSFIRKARLLNKEFRDLVDKYQSIYLNQRLENYGEDMPGPSENVTERKYNDLLSGKGCMEKDCTDTKASRTHWSWEIRLCQSCWKSKIEREDRLQKIWQNQLTRNGINRLLECIPVGMHDSFMKPHDYIEDVESRPRGAPRLYRYHFKENVEKIVAEYEALKAPPYQENPEHSAAEKASALAAHQALENEFVAKRAEFLEKRKAQNDEHMKRVVKIETAIRNRRVKVAQPYDANRAARKERFTRGAEADLPHIPIEFVQSTKAYKAAVRIFRDPGTERGWQLLKPKIEAEWEQSAEKKTVEDNARNGNMDDNSTTRESSTFNETEQTPDPTSDQIQHHLQQRQLHASSNSSVLSAAHQQQMLNMVAAQRNEILHSVRMNGINQFRPTSYHNGMNQSSSQGFQPQRVSANLMLPTSTYHHNEAMNRNDFSMSGPALQLPSSYASYNAFSSTGNFNLNSSSQQVSNTQIPIDSLLNGPSAAVPPGYDWA